MNMKLIDCLACMMISVDADPVPIIELLLLSELRRNIQKVAQDWLILVRNLSQIRYGLSGYDEIMYRGNRIDVLDGEAGVVLINESSWDLFSHDLVEDRVPLLTLGRHLYSSEVWAR